MANFITRILRGRNPKPSAPTYYHGGAPGLKVGDTILPRNAQPAWQGLEVIWSRQKASALGDLGNTVSITTDINIATAYAGEYLAPTDHKTPGQVYRVEPLQQPEPDPDWPASFPTIARCTHGAKIIEALEHVPIQPNARVIVKALGKHYVFKDGRGRAYTNDGHLIYHPSWAATGATPTDLRALGPWIPIRLLFNPAGRFEPPNPLPPLI